MRLLTTFFARCCQGLLCLCLSFPAHSQEQASFPFNLMGSQPTPEPNNHRGTGTTHTTNTNTETSPTPFAFAPVVPTDFLFVPGTTTLQAGEEERIANYGQRLKENRNIRINLIGHTSHLGSRAYSLAVAELRVSMIKKALMQNGARAQQIRIYPIGSEGDGQHSRVELQVLP